MTRYGETYRAAMASKMPTISLVRKGNRDSQRIKIGKSPHIQSEIVVSMAYV
jgi:hypothetical protein